MRKAVIIGGSNGLGLTISSLLVDKGYFLEICDRVEPEKGILPGSAFHFNHCDLTDFNESLFKELSCDEEVDTLIITAGIGRIAEFEHFHVAEVDKTMTINVVSIIKILRVFYDKIKNNKTFYTGVTCSISAWLVSPFAGLYAASKAALARFIESINIELEMSGTSNRILDISPATFKGSKFYGGKNDIDLIRPIAEEALNHLFAKDTIYIPDYEKTIKSVLERYRNDPHAFGLQSYEYKKKSGRIDNKSKVVIGYLSGTFDLFHVGHLNILRKAKAECDYLVVGVHASGKRKGKPTFIPLEERKAILKACKYVDEVVDALPEDTDIWPELHYNRLFVGSDYKGSERFNRYEEYFADKDARIIYFPYTEGTSSTIIREKILKQNQG